jgi:putative FmdB family regulatory protein
MPLYEYVCPECKKTVEKLVFGKEMDEEQLCDKCKKPMTRVLSTYSFDIHGYCYKNEYAKSKPT